jgi:hypothetical protein
VSQAHFRRFVKFMGAAFGLVLVSNSQAQSSGAVPGNCTVNAAGTELTCTTTVRLSGVSAAFANGQVTLQGGPTGPACNGGLVITSPTSTTIPSGTATAVQLDACPSNTNRAGLNYRWLAPAQPASANSSAWLGSATVTLAAGERRAFVVDVCADATAGAACTRVSSAELIGQGAVSCGAVSPATQTVNQNAAAAALTASCTGATSYQWYAGNPTAGGVAVNGATGVSFTPPTSAIGTVAYFVRGSNGTTTSDSPAGGAVTVQAVVGGCNLPIGMDVAYGTSAQLTDRSSVGPGAVFVTKITVGAGDSTIGRQLLPNYYFYYNDNSTFSDRTITVSKTCGDFTSAEAIQMGQGISGTVRFVTTGDTRGGPQIPTLTPGVWYVNMRSDTCPAGVNCSFGVGWRASTF